MMMRPLGIVAASAGAAAPAALYDLRNTLAGISNGTAITPANSGTGGDAFDVDVLVGGTVVANTSADLAGDGQGMIASLTSGTAATLEWALTSAVEGYAQVWIRTPASNPGQNTRFMRFESGGTVIMDARLVSGTQRISINADNATQSEYVDVSASTIYRVGLGIDAAGLARLKVWDAAGTPLTTAGSGLSGRAAHNKIRFGLVSNAQTFSLELAQPSFRASDWVDA